jgi:hypothetical protein
MNASTPGSREHMKASPRPAGVEASPGRSLPGSMKEGRCSHLVEARFVGVKPERDAAAQLPLAVFTQQPEADELASDLNVMPPLTGRVHAAARGGRSSRTTSVVLSPGNALRYARRRVPSATRLGGAGVTQYGSSVAAQNSRRLASSDPGSGRVQSEQPPGPCCFSAAGRSRYRTRPRAATSITVST